MEDKNLIVVKQLPIIEEQLKSVSEEIDIKVGNALNLVCNEETVKVVKQVRADMNKDLKEFEEQRKNVKEQVMKPYNDFELIYKKYISDKYKNADIELKNKVDSVENELKVKKSKEIEEYFLEYIQSKNIDFVTYEQTKINVTLSSSIKSLKEQIKLFVDKIVDDLNLIETQDHKTEMLVEYKQTLNVSQAITTVNNRFKAIEEEKKKQEEAQKLQEFILETAKESAHIPTIEEVPQVTLEAPTEFIIRRTINIKLNATNEEFEKVKRFFELSNIYYESEEV